MLQVGRHRSVFLRKVRKAGKAAILHLLLVVPVVDNAVRVVVRRLVKRHKVVEIAGATSLIPDMIDHHVDHDLQACRPEHPGQST